MSDILGGLASVAASAFNVHEMRQNRRFQRDMSNSEMQRRVADLKASGLNPMLAVTQGGGGHGASTPATSAAQIQSPDINPLSNLQQLAGIQESQARTAKDLEEAGQTKRNNQWFDQTMETRLLQLRNQYMHELDRRDLTKAEIDKTWAQIDEIDEQIENINIRTAHSAYDLDRMEAESSYWQSMGPLGVGLDKLSGPVSSALGLGLGAGRLITMAKGIKAGAAARRFGAKLSLRAAEKRYRPTKSDIRRRINEFGNR